MKKLYNEPEFNMTLLATNDVITYSGYGLANGDGSGDGDEQKLNIGDLF